MERQGPAHEGYAEHAGQAGPFGLAPGSGQAGDGQQEWSQPAGQWAAQQQGPQQQWGQPGPHWGPDQQWSQPYPQGQQWQGQPFGRPQWGPPPKRSAAPLVLAAVLITALVAGGAWLLTRPPGTPAPVAAATPVKASTPKAAATQAKPTPVPTVTKVVERVIERERGTTSGMTSYDPGVKRCSSDGSWGAYASVNTGTSSTSCTFARNVRRDYVQSGRSSGFYSYSPVTGKTYWMSCSGSEPVRCTGGVNAVIYIGNW